jgi:hypothetical protein
VVLDPKTVKAVLKLLLRKPETLTGRAIRSMKTPLKSRS